MPIGMADTLVDISAVNAVILLILVGVLPTMAAMRSILAVTVAERESMQTDERYSEQVFLQQVQDLLLPPANSARTRLENGRIFQR